MSALPVLAHQGGWDEMLYVLVPIGLFAWLLSLANKRATREQAARQAAQPPDEDATEHSEPDAGPPDDAG
jgi:hypothetical protein